MREVRLAMSYPGAIVGGETISGSVRLSVLNPATGMAVGDILAADSDICEAAVAAARSAFPDWAARPDAERQAAVNRCAEIIGANAERLAQLLTAEQGKPLDGTGSRFEIGGAVAWTRHTASLPLPIELVQDDPQAHIAIHRRPLGV